MPVPMGLTTGQTPMSSKSFNNLTLTCSTLPTNCKSYPSLLMDLEHCKRESSRPLKPKARPPWLQILLAISLFTLPQSTISATSTTSRLDTRRPPSKRDSTPTFSSMALIWGPPPCTTTTLRPSFCRAATSWQNKSFNSTDVMALPPYLTTTIWPLRASMAPAVVRAASAKSVLVVVSCFSAVLAHKTVGLLRLEVRYLGTEKPSTAQSDASWKTRARYIMIMVVLLLSN
mmetsp:Transcript_21801/g.60606  ORF Transcript_21801/g.60606 Transcript_21801/m.60606 type:complete len:230 (-) Transcript_21801:81-770(-)